MFMNVKIIEIRACFFFSNYKVGTSFAQISDQIGLSAMEAGS